MDGFIFNTVQLKNDVAATNTFISPTPFQKNKKLGNFHQ